MKRLLLCLTLFAPMFTGYAQPFVSQRPAPADRLFVSRAVEQKIEQVQRQLANPRLAWMFANCFPNTLDTTVHFGKDEAGRWRTFVYTGDIHAMWLRDSGAQVWPYVQLAPEDAHLRNMLAGVINCQFSLLCIDPYANAFNDGATGTGWQSDLTQMDPNLHERKWEIDSQCYPIRLAYHYWKTTGDTSVFGEVWLEAIQKMYKDPELDVQGLANEMGMSRSLLNEKIQSSFGQSIAQFIRTYRLNVAKEMICNGTSKDLNISEIAYEIGFNDPKYFTRCFTKEFNATPSDLFKENN